MKLKASGAGVKREAGTKAESGTKAIKPTKAEDDMKLKKVTLNLLGSGKKINAKKIDGKLKANSKGENAFSTFFLSPEIIKAFDSTLTAELHKYNFMPEQGKQALFYIPGNIELFDIK
ncbi:hypothetical protein M422DRAFT_249121 [Sphaerobolus stellatus SS14]|nr:hypothetical protein M422DRAFT_249121 [Sphaerobolus stellatus SS14]